MSVIDYVKEAANLAKEHGRMDLYEKLLDYRMETADLREMILKQRDEIEGLRERLKLKSQIVFERGIYWIEKDEMTKNGDKTVICPKCYAIDNLIMRLSVYEGSDRPSVWCPNCRANHYFNYQ